MVNAMGEIEAVLFDYGMVLSLGPDAGAWARMKAVLGMDEDELHAAYWAHRDAYDCGRFTGAGYWDAVAGRALDAGAKAELLAADLDLWGQLNLPMVEWAARLQKAGVKTGVLSNIGDVMAEGLVERFVWLAEFTHCTWSHSLKTMKPDLAIYRHAVEGLGVEAASVLFVDDKAVNVEAAREVGMRAVQYLGHEDFLARMKSEGLGDLLEV